MSAFVYPASSGGGHDDSTVIYKVAFSAIADHNFKTTSTLSMGGVTWTAHNATNASKFEVKDGVLTIDPNSSTGHAGGTFNAPTLTAQWADLMTDSASGSYDTAKTYSFRAIMSSQISPGQGGPFAGISTVWATANKDISMQRSGVNWRLAKGGSTYQDVAAGSTGVTGGFRSIAVKYGQGSFSAFASTTATHAGEAFGGVPIYAGYMRAATNSTGFSYLPAPPDILDLSVSTAQAYLGAWYWSGGDPGAFSFEQIELHEVG